MYVPIIAHRTDIIRVIVYQRGFRTYYGHNKTRKIDVFTKFHNIRLNSMMKFHFAYYKIFFLIILPLIKNIIYKV